MQSVGKKKGNIIDQDGYETSRTPRPRTPGQHMPDICVADGEKPGGSVTKDLSI